MLVNVDNATLARLLNNQDALDALMRIEGFRSLNQDIETIINKSEHVKKAKKRAKKNLRLRRRRNFRKRKRNTSPSARKFRKS